jgi:hypothetical protein
MMRALRRGRVRQAWNATPSANAATPPPRISKVDYVLTEQSGQDAGAAERIARARSPSRKPS